MEEGLKCEEQKKKKKKKRKEDGIVWWEQEWFGRGGRMENGRGKSHGEWGENEQERHDMTWYDSDMT